MSGKPFGDVVCGPDTRAKNDAVRKALDDYGDDGSETRNVRHFFFPKHPSLTDPSALIVSLKAYGYAIAPTNNGGLIAEENHEVASSEFDRSTQGLDDLANKIGWSYDGWECEVVTD